MANVDDTTLKIWGAGHLAGSTVAVSVAGVDMGDYTVAADGSVTVTYGSDVSGKVTAAYLAANFQAALGTDHDVAFAVYTGGTSVNVTVPLLVGLAYTATGQRIRPATLEPNGMLAGRGPELGKNRRGHKYAMLVEGVSQLKVGTSISNLISASLSSDGQGTPELALADDVPYTGVLVQPLADGSGYDTQLLWQCGRPYRMTLSMLSVFAEGE